MKRLSATLLALALTLCMISPSWAEDANYPDAELTRAVTLGFGEYKTDDPPISYAEFFKLLDRTVELADRGKLAEWQGLFQRARAANTAILRCQAILAIYMAAETLGPEYVVRNNSPRLGTLLQIAFPGDETGGTTEFNEYDYSMFEDTLPSIHAKNKYGEGSYTGDAYEIALGKLSLVTCKPILDFDTDANSFRLDECLTYSEALLAALRLYESELPPESPRIPTTLDEEILAKADARREAIRNTPTTVAVTGKSYYVSNDGNDKNNGLSPEKAWKTLDKVNKFKLEPGDGVFFRRGDIWRFQQFDAKEGVTYSAYGEGEKPRFYGSPENGADPSKWKLVRGTDNIWVYGKDMRDCGAIVFNEGESYAQKAYLYWDGEKYVTFTSANVNFNVLGDEAFMPADLENLYFYNDIKYNKVKIATEASPVGEDYHRLLVMQHNNLKGKLYLRCDAGNPGDVYESIEFCVDRSDTQEFMIGVYTTGVTIDNLCLKYSAHGISLGMPTTMQYNNQDFSKGAPNVIQNCEIGWMAGVTHWFESVGTTVYSGDGIHVEGNNNLAFNNYIYECQDNAIAVEVCPTYLDFGADWYEMDVSWDNLTLKGNLLERSNSGIFFMNWEIPEVPGHMFRNATIMDNTILYSGYGHSGKRDRDLLRPPVQGRVELENSYGHSLNFYGPDYFANANDGIYVRDNIFYLSTNTLICSGMPQQYYPQFSGNTYVQSNYGRLAYWREPDGREVIVNMARPDIEEYVKTMLGDDEAIIAPISE